MSFSADEVLAAALKLSEPEQIVLVARLLEAMPPDSRALFMDVVDADDEFNTNSEGAVAEAELPQSEQA